MDEIHIKISHPLLDKEESIDFFQLGNVLANKAHKELANCPAPEIVMLGMAYFSLLATFMNLTDVKILSDRKANILEMIEKIFEKKIQHEIEKLEKGIKEDNSFIKDIKIKQEFFCKKSKKDKKKKGEPEDKDTLMREKIQGLNHLIINELMKDDFSMAEILNGLTNLLNFLFMDSLRAIVDINSVKAHGKLIEGLLQKSVEQRIEIIEKEMKEGEKSNGK